MFIMIAIDRISIMCSVTAIEVQSRSPDAGGRPMQPMYWWTTRIGEGCCPSIEAGPFRAQGRMPGKKEQETCQVQEARDVVWLRLPQTEHTGWPKQRLVPVGRVEKDEKSWCGQR